jgi:hypothetical protein
LHSVALELRAQVDLDVARQRVRHHAHPLGLAGRLLEAVGVEARYSAADVEVDMRDLIAAA